MFENLSTALIQLIGFLGIFGFFIYQLLSENKFFDFSSNNPPVKKSKTDSKIIPKRKGLFGKKVAPVEEKIISKKGWFK